MLKIKAEARTITGKKVQTLRNQAQIPAVLYGPTLKKSESLVILLSDFQKIWRDAGESSIVDLEIAGEKPQKVLIHDVAFDAIKDKPIHVDFYAVDIAKPIHVHVPLRFTGVAPAVKTLGGVLVKLMHEVEIEVLPHELPHDIEVNIELLETFDHHITLKDLKLPEGVILRGEKDAFVAMVETPRKEEELVEEPKEIDFDTIEDAGKKEKAEKEPAEGETAEGKPSENT